MMAHHAIITPKNQPASITVWALEAVLTGSVRSADRLITSNLGTGGMVPRLLVNLYSDFCADKSSSLSFGAAKDFLVTEAEGGPICSVTEGGGLRFSTTQSG